jgi:hypothetical protein
MLSLKSHVTVTEVIFMEVVSDALNTDARLQMDVLFM